MTREEFIQVLDREGYSYEIEGDKLVVNHVIQIDLDQLKTLPPGVVFNNSGGVYLDSLKTISPGVEFKNEGRVDLRSLEILPPGVKFNNRGDVFLKTLVGVWFGYWKGNIEGIDSKRLLNLMIKQGVFI